MSLGPGSSAIIDLKAELLRKRNQLELRGRQHSEKFSENTVRAGGFRIERREPKVLGKCSNPPEGEKHDGYDEALMESRRRLEEKAIQYEALKNDCGSYPRTHEDDAFLVDFRVGRKLELLNSRENEKQEQVKNRGRQGFQEDSHSPKVSEDRYDDNNDDDDDDEWTTFTDVLGRTRKCLKTELGHFREADNCLRQSLESRRLPEMLGEIPVSGPGASLQHDVGITGTVELIQRGAELNHTAEDPETLERIRRWAEIEQENSAKEHVHYRDVQFDEIREHGQAHFEFSRNEAERLEQMKTLDKLREESTRAQKNALEVKRRRQHQLQQRLNRIRQKKGLPLADAEQEEKANTTGKAGDVKVVCSSQASASEQKPLVTQVPPPSSSARASSTHIRPWDEGKELHGVPIRIPAGSKRSRGTVEDYMEQLREERVSEFAPPSSYGRMASTSRQDLSEHGSISSTPMNRLQKRSESDIANFVKTMRNLGQ